MADKLQIMLELEKRGVLPKDKQAIVDELRRRGAIPNNGMENYKSNSLMGSVKNMGKTAIKDTLNILPETVGMVGGGIIGSALGPAGAVAGAGLGAAGLHEAKQIFKTATGQIKPRSLRQASSEALSVGKLGAEFEMGGHIAGKVLPPLIKGAGNIVKQSGIPEILKSIPKTFSRTKQIELWNNAKSQMFESRGNIIDQYGDALQQAKIKNPNAAVNLKPVMKGLQDEDAAGILDPKVKLAINSNPKFKAIYENPELATKLNATQTQDILNAISNKFPESKLSGKSAYRPSDMALKSLQNEIKSAQIEAYPDMIPVKKNYGEFMQAYKGMKNEFLSKHFFDNLDRNFSNPIVRNYIDKVLPAEAIKDLNGYRMAAKAIKWGKYATGVAALGGAGISGANLFK